MHTARKCRMPKVMMSSGRASHVTSVTPMARAKSFSPRTRLECERLHAMPEMNMKSPAKNGSAGMKKWKKNYRREITEQKTDRVESVVEDHAENRDAAQLVHGPDAAGFLCRKTVFGHFYSSGCFGGLFRRFRTAARVSGKTRRLSALNRTFGQPDFSGFAGRETVSH